MEKQKSGLGGSWFSAPRVFRVFRGVLLFGRFTEIPPTGHVVSQESRVYVKWMELGVGTRFRRVDLRNQS